MKNKLEINIYDINEIKESARNNWTKSPMNEDEPVVKSYISAVFDFLNKYGYLEKDSLELTFTKDRVIRKKLHEE